MANWPSLLMAALSACLSALAFWWSRKERDAGVRMNIFSLIHPEGQPWPPFGKADLVVPTLSGLVALAFLANFLGIF